MGRCYGMDTIETQGGRLAIKDMTWPIGPNLAPGWIAATIKEEGQTRGCDKTSENQLGKRDSKIITVFAIHFAVPSMH
ncbi:hypothetical protein O181_107205 [Austropuccinia psidii MF-1]|uniref:Uncharacterized protein n=1 Tax=Austropuccinia psidii MF-1 TaxID=1389203 RepID=A0A9Q3JTZ3_9BASI|nr:hypothetical protein [Austropuccinia psidii MF-1]